MEIFQYDFMRLALIAIIFIAVVAPILGLFLILRRQSMLVDTLSHVSLAGVTIGFLIGQSLPFTTAIIVAIVALILEYLRKTYKHYSEVALALVMSGATAIALILSSAVGGGINIESFLFGSILTISDQQIIALAILSVLIVVLYLIFNRPMYVLTFDENTAITQGLPVSTISNIFMVLVGVVISLMMPIVGSLLVAAVLIMPATIAMRWMKSFNKVIILGIIIAFVGMFSGLLMSYYWGTPPGASIVVVYMAAFIITFAYEKITQKISA